MRVVVDEEEMNLLKSALSAARDRAHCSQEVTSKVSSSDGGGDDGGGGCCCHSRLELLKATLD